MRRAAVTSYVRRRCSPDDVEDVVADTFMTCWRRLDHVPAGAELPWLYNVAGHILRNRYRARTRDNELVTLIHPSADSGDIGRARGTGRAAPTLSAGPGGSAARGVGGAERSPFGCCMWMLPNSRTGSTAPRASTTAMRARPRRPPT